MGVLGAIGTALVAGVQLGSIGALDWPDPRLVAAFVAFGIAVLGIARLLRQAGAVLAPDTTNLHDLVHREGLPRKDREEIGDIVVELEKQPWLSRGWGPKVRDLKGQYEHVLEEAYDAYRASWDDKLAEAAGLSRQQSEEQEGLRLDVADDRYNDVDAAVGAVIDQAHFLRFKTRYLALIRSLGSWGVIVGLAIAIFAWAANPPDDSDDETATDEVAVLEAVVVALTPAGQNAVGPALGSGCDLEAAPAIVLARDEDVITVVTSGADGCSAVRFDVTCALGEIRAKVAGTITRVGPRCS